MPPIHITRTEPRRTIGLARDREGHDDGQRHADEDQAHRALGQVEALLDPRDLRDPGADDGAVTAKKRSPVRGGSARLMRASRVTPRAR